MKQLVSLVSAVALVVDESVPPLDVAEVVPALSLPPDIESVPADSPPEVPLPVAESEPAVAPESVAVAVTVAGSVPPTEVVTPPSSPLQPMVATTTASSSP